MAAVQLSEKTTWNFTKLDENSRTQNGALKYLGWGSITRKIQRNLKLQLSTSRLKTQESRAQDLPLKPGQEKNFQIENSEQAGHTSKNYHDMGDSGITYNQGEDGSNLLKLDTGAWDDEGKTDDYLFAFQILFCGSK